MSDRFLNGLLNTWQRMSFLRLNAVCVYLAVLT